MKKLQQYFSEIRLFDVILFALATSLILSLSSYSFGRGNHTEQLPMIFRAMDPDYLVNDPFVNASEAYGPRTYYSQTMGYLAQTVEIEFLFLYLYIISNYLIILVTILSVYFLFNKSKIIALLTGFILLTIVSVPLGSYPSVFAGAVIPGQLIMFLLLAALWFGLNKQVVGGVLLACVGAIFHSLVGFEVAAIVLSLCTALWLYDLIIKKEFNKQQGLKLLISSMILVVFGQLLLGGYLDQPKIDDALFVEIIAYFRHPHHYLPSMFSLKEYFDFSVFITGTYLAWTVLAKKYKKVDDMGLPLLILYLGIFVLSLGGYLFVEVFPSRLWTTAQTFRLLFVPKYFGIVLYGAHVASVFPADENSKTYREFIILLMGIFSPLTMGLAEMALYVNKKLEDASRRNTVYLIALVLVLILNLDRFSFLFFLFFLIAVILIFTPNRLFYYAGLVAIIPVIVFHAKLPLPNSVDVFIENLFFPDLTFQNSLINEENADIIEFVKENTPEDSLFITPPYFGFFRNTAKRAIVADWEAIPFQDTEMSSWYDRLLNIYGGKPEAQGHNAMWEFNKRYYDITDTRLQKLSNLYDADYAILSLHTPSELPVLYKNQRYKIVSLSP